MSILRIFALIAAILVLLMMLLAGSVYYVTEMELTPVVTEVSPNGKAELTICQVGEPAWPFGPTDCRFDLYVDNKRVVKYPFSIHNDGVPASENNFCITWYEDYVQILVSAEEQLDEVCSIYFDGMVGWMQKDKV